MQIYYYSKLLQFMHSMKLFLQKIFRFYVAHMCYVILIFQYHIHLNYVARTRRFWPSTCVRHVSDTGTGKTPLKSIPEECSPSFFLFFFFFFFWKKSGYVANTVVTCRNLPNTTKLKNKRERERVSRIWTNTSLFPSILWSNLCAFLE